jgi:hypothetical protein
MVKDAEASGVDLQAARDDLAAGVNDVRDR